MATETIIKRIKADFQFLNKNPNVLGVILYGSYVREDYTQRSDIDICVVAPLQNRYRLYQSLVENLKSKIERYDIRFFEELNLYIQGKIIETGKVVLSRDEPALYEYLFQFRKRWKDLKYRLKILNQNSN
ncbi:MAG: nucleotidyltransferase family protein [Candidatus Helarchaeota archaeon]